MGYFKLFFNVVKTYHTYIKDLWSKRTTVVGLNKICVHASEEEGGWMKAADVGHSGFQRLFLISLCAMLWTFYQRLFFMQ